MHVEWYGHSAFRLSTPEQSVFIDPFGDFSALARARGMQFDYPAIDGVEADVLLVTHEHMDHNHVDGIAGSPAVLRSTAGRLESPVGEVLAVASEHDQAAGTERGPNTIFVLSFDDVRVAHFGDFGQAALRPEQAAAIGDVDLVFLPVGGSLTIDAAGAAAIVEELGPRWVVPMHYRTHRIGFLETEAPFVERMPHVHRVDSTAFSTGELPAADGPLVVVPDAP